MSLKWHINKLITQQRVQIQLMLMIKMKIKIYQLKKMMNQVILY
jgi:hypothetical protein